MMLVLLFILVFANGGGQVNGFFLGTQSIYGPSWQPYNFTSAKDVLTDNRLVVNMLGLNQMKIHLAPSSTCLGYHLNCSEQINSLKTLTQQKSIAATFAHPSILW